MNRIAACLIAGDSWRESEIKQMLASIEGHVDGIYVAYNGKKPRLKWNKWTSTPFKFQKFVWEDDFAKARQQSFDMVPREQYDWYLWLDTDDVLEGGDNLPALFNSLDPYTQGVYLKYDYIVEPKTGRPVVQQWRERLLSTAVTWFWKYPIHEVASGPIGTQYAKREGTYVRHLRTQEEDRGARERNRKIIAKTLKEYPDHPRFLFYLGNETMAEADSAQAGTLEKGKLADAAIFAFQKYLKVEENPTDDRYLAQSRIGDLYLMKGEWGEAINAYLESLKIYPEWPDAYIGIARACMESEDWERCRAFSNMALNLPKPETASAITPLTFDYTPLLLRGIAHEELGDWQRAKDDYEAALAAWEPNTPMLRQRLEKVKAKLAVTGKDTDERKRLRGSRPEKSIAFVTAPIPEPWHPYTERTGGAGGAETCIMRLAPMFAADGWRVAVFGTPGKENRGVDEHGVEWWDAMEYIPNEPFSVFVSSRTPEVFGADVNSPVKILWMHDVNVGPRLYPFSDRPDVIVGLTEWHVSHMSRLYGIDRERFSIVPNGIDLSLYPDKPKVYGKTLNFIWSSSPDRGLGTLVSLWPHIKKAVPESRLDVFYGWNIIDKLIKHDPRRGAYLWRLKQDILGNIAMLGGEEAGIFQHGRVPQSELAQWQAKAHVWPYPTDFMETFCITAVEMQAAGVVPVTSYLGALKETVAMKKLMIDGWPLNRDYQQRWLNLLYDVIESPEEEMEETLRIGRLHAEQFSWENAYTKWNDMFRSING